MLKRAKTLVLYFKERNLKEYLNIFNFFLIHTLKNLYFFYLYSEKFRTPSETR